MNNSIAKVLLCVLIACAAPAWAAEDADPPGKQKRQRISSWWQEPTAIAALELTEDQRNGMDRSREQYVQAREQHSDRMKSLQASFGQALMAGDGEKRSELIEQIVAEAGVEARNNVVFKMGVLDLLSDTQKTALTSRYPEVIEKQWGKRTRSFTKQKDKSKESERKQEEKGAEGSGKDGDT